MTQPVSSHGSDAARGSFIETVCSLGVWAGGVTLFVISFSVCVEVLVRKFFNTSIQGIDELAGYGMAISFAWAMPYAIRTNAHIRVRHPLHRPAADSQKPFRYRSLAFLHSLPVGPRLFQRAAVPCVL